MCRSIPVCVVNAWTMYTVSLPGPASLFDTPCPSMLVAPPNLSPKNASVFLTRGGSIYNVANARSRGDVYSDMMGELLHAVSSTAHGKQRAINCIDHARVSISHLRLSNAQVNHSPWMSGREAGGPSKSRGLFNPAAIPLAGYQVTSGWKRVCGLNRR